MNNVSQKFFLVLASAALVFAGCSKKPNRPDPGQTIMGGKTGPGSETLNVTGGEVPPDRTGGIDPGTANRNILESVYFDFNESNIKPAERAKLQKAKEYLDQHAGSRLVLEGHCDWRGTEEYNLGLGDRRAAAVKKYLGTIGVHADQLETLSKGSLEALKNSDDATAAKDRRVDLLVAPAK